MNCKILERRPFERVLSKHKIRILSIIETSSTSWVTQGIGNKPPRRSTIDEQNSSKRSQKEKKNFTHFIKSKTGRIRTHRARQHRPKKRNKSKMEAARFVAGRHYRVHYAGRNYQSLEMGLLPQPAPLPRTRYCLLISPHWHPLPTEDVCIVCCSKIMYYLFSKGIDNSQMPIN